MLGVAFYHIKSHLYSKLGLASATVLFVDLLSCDNGVVSFLTRWRSVYDLVLRRQMCMVGLST